MSVAGARNGTTLGWALVTVQAALFVGIGLWPTSWGPSTPPVRELGGVLFLAGGVGMLLSARHLGRSLTPLPEPNGAGLRTRGVYRWVRHPMYSAILVVVVGVAFARGSLVVWVLVGLLAALFAVKARREEARLFDVYEGYEAYAATTGRFIPRVGTVTSKR